MNIDSKPHDDTRRHYLIFTLDDELFGLDVVRVQEVVRGTTLIPVLSAPRFIRGLINLRGAVLPVMDLRLHYGMPPAVRTEETCVIVVEMRVGGQVILVGVLADAVQGIVDLAPDQVEATSPLATKANTDLLRTWARRLTTS